MPPERFDLPLRIVMEGPVPGYAITLQRGQAAKAELLPPVERSADALAFDLDVVVDGRLPDGRPRFLGRKARPPRGSSICA